ncbi:reverse transcriptase domain-containing protein [Tanacetum coccineum]|uniref:Reverse transcriptase domain-containing protein n=1 Tax=Tanacetum coccineum TaxID=301880 RepID=A0ABQ5A8L0_9ASTR
MKKVITELPLLTTPRKEETLYVYLAATEKAVSAVLLAERSGKQCPIHYVTHNIKVITDQPLKQILNKAQASGKLAKYSIELGTYNITYDPRNAVKGQVLADFLSEAPAGVSPEEFFRLPEQIQSKDVVETWTLFTNGASNSKGSGLGLVLIRPEGTEFTYALRLNFTSTNNEAEYEALLAGLRLAKKMKVQTIDVKVDSKLVASQINGDYVGSSTDMIRYQATAKECIARFKGFTIKNNPSSSSSDSEVDSCSKTCVKAYATLKEQYDSLSSDYKKSQFNLVSYKAGLESVEARLAHYKKNEVVFEESINVLKLESLNDLLESKVIDKFKTGLGYNVATAASPTVESFVNLSYKSRLDTGYLSVPPPLTGNFIPRKPDLTFIDEIVESKNLDVTTVVTPSNDKTVKNKGVSNTVESNIGNPQQKEYKEKAVIDSGCSRDHLGKFNGRGNEGYFVGYPVERDQLAFDVDFLTISMNYVPVVAENQTNGIAGTKDNIVAGPKDSEGDAGMESLPECG